MERPVFLQAPKPAALLLIAMLAACGGSATSSENAGGAGGTTPAPTVDEGVYDFLATELNFYYPEGLGESDTEAPNPCGLATLTDNTTGPARLHSRGRQHLARQHRGLRAFGH